MIKRQAGRHKKQCSKETKQTILMQTQTQTLVSVQIVVIAEAAAVLYKSVLARSKDSGLHSTQVGD